MAHNKELHMPEIDAFIDQIITGDCLQVLNCLPEKSVDLVFADPPYNLQLERELWRPNATRVNGVDDAWDQFTSFDSYDRFTSKWLEGCRRVLKDTGTIWVIGSYHNIFRVGKVMQDLGYWILNDIVWIKNNPMPNFRGVRFTNAHETLIWAQKLKGKKYTFNYRMMKSINQDKPGETGVQMRSDWHLPLCTGRERLKVNGEKAHPTQKPEALLERIVKSSTNPGDVILDPFLGTGTTGAMAKKLGRHWIGIEKDPRYVTLARQRIEAVQVENSLINYPSNKARPYTTRIPFSMLVQRGLIKVGQILYFGQSGNLQAIVLANGHIRFGDVDGSIHKVGREISRAPCNGWLAWYYINDTTGMREPIDRLRQMTRNGMITGEVVSVESEELL